jgi:hypothetical protein
MLKLTPEMHQPCLCIYQSYHRDQLADMLHQSYIHGSEHGWKTHYAEAKECLQAAYEQDMQDASTAFAENMKEIQEEAYDCGFEYGRDGCEAQLASLQESLTAEHDKRHLETIINFSERCQEFREAGICEEQECKSESARASQPSVAIQTDPITTSSTSVQTNNPIISLSASASISTQTKPLLPTILSLLNHLFMV